MECILIENKFNKMLKMSSIEDKIHELGLAVAGRDFNRPWGGYFVIDEKDTLEFANCFFRGINTDIVVADGKISPKILVVEARKRLSWQYHQRRAEVWRVIKGQVGVIRSNNDIQNGIKVYRKGEYLRLEQGERHRLVGLDEDCIVAEIWQHTNADHPSNENDIVRVQDDFGREKVEFGFV